MITGRRAGERADSPLFLALSSDDLALLSDYALTGVTQASEAVHVMHDGVTGGAGRTDGEDMARAAPGDVAQSLLLSAEVGGHE